MDHDDWRVTISFADRLQAERAKVLFPRHRVDEDARHRLGGSIAVGAGDSEVFLYTGTEAAAREAERTAREVLGRHHITAEFAIHRWHPVEQEWEGRDVALPRTDAERQAEHQRLMAEETAESRAVGAAQWQVRAELASHQEAVALAGKLRGQGRPVIRRWTFLVVSADNEDEAEELAGQISREAPAGTAVRAGHAPVLVPFIGM
jgi:cobalamin biosynthesis protein CobT